MSSRATDLQALLSPLRSATRTRLKKHLGRSYEHLDVHSAAALVRENRDEVWKAPVENGLLIFGAAANGDAWAIDVARGERVVLLSHDRIWDQQVRTPRGALEPIAGSLSETLAWAEDCALPVDYYDAKALKQALAAAPRDAAPVIRMAFGRCINHGVEVALTLEDFLQRKKDGPAPTGYQVRQRKLPTKVLHATLRAVRRRRSVQEVLVRVCDVAGAWPAFDTVYVFTSADQGTLVEWLAPHAPAAIERRWRYDRPDYAVPRPKKGFRPFSIWWA